MEQIGKKDYINEKIPVSKLRYTDVQKALIESVAEKNI